jgi:leader peptidase (prepilin peptidase)/N-methyltransferase
MGDFLKRDPIGGGDLKLIASIGILTGTCGGIGAICIGSFIGIIFYVIKRKTLLTKQTPTLAFGPPLLFGAILYLLIKPYFFDFVIQNTDALIQPQ